MEYEIGQQVVIRRRVSSFPQTFEVKVGTILAFGDKEKTQATVTIPLPGGRIQRQEIPVNELEPVSARFKRASVQANPAFRQIGMRSM